MKKKTVKKKVQKKVIKKTDAELLRRDYLDLKHHMQHLVGMLEYERGQRLDLEGKLQNFAKGVRRDINHVHERINKIDPEEQKLKEATASLETKV